MAEPPGRITPITNLSLWENLYAQWIEEGRPGWVTRQSGGTMWRVVQLTSGSPAFDPVNNEEYYDGTGFNIG